MQNRTNSQMLVAGIHLRLNLWTPYEADPCLTGSTDKSVCVRECVCVSYRSFWMLEAIPERRYMPSTTPCFSMNSVQLLSTWGTGAGNTKSETTRHSDNFKKGISTSINRCAPENTAIHVHPLIMYRCFLSKENAYILPQGNTSYEGFWIETIFDVLW